MTKPVRHVRACQLPPTDIPQLHRVDASTLPGGIYLSDPPPYESTPETRAVRAEFWRSVVLPVAVITLAVVCYVAIVDIG